MLVLSGDIGGTNTRLQIAEIDAGNQLTVISREEFFSASSPNFISLLYQFIETTNISPSELNAACFAIAGPIVEQQVQCTNLPWVISANNIHNKLKINHVKLINDFQAIGHGIQHISADDYETLQAGTEVTNGPKAYVGAGTGLGMGMMNSIDNTYQVQASEGGHIDFSPTDDEQAALLVYLRKKLHRVSTERIVSGIGLINIYKYAKENPIYGEQENPELKHLLFQKECASYITKYAIQYQDPLAMRTLDIFIKAYGSCVGNLALTTLPTGGLYIVGGIAPKLLPQLNDGRFMQALTDKGRISKVLQNIPVKVVLNGDIGITGAAHHGGTIAASMS
jgi:glucokinase